MALSRAVMGNNLMTPEVDIGGLLLRPFGLAREGVGAGTEAAVGPLCTMQVSIGLNSPHILAELVKFVPFTLPAGRYHLELAGEVVHLLRIDAPLEISGIDLTPAERICTPESMPLLLSTPETRSGSESMLNTLKGRIMEAGEGAPSGEDLDDTVVSLSFQVLNDQFYRMEIHLSPLPVDPLAVSPAQATTPILFTADALFKELDMLVRKEDLKPQDIRERIPRILQGIRRKGHELQAHASCYDPDAVAIFSPITGRPRTESADGEIMIVDSFASDQLLSDIETVKHQEAEKARLRKAQDSA